MNDGIKEHNCQVNTYQTQAWRRLKRRICRHLGATYIEANRMRDWRLMTIKGYFSNLLSRSPLLIQSISDFFAPYEAMDAQGASQTYQETTEGSYYF